jgi:hypothetical protein
MDPNTESRLARLERVNRRLMIGLSVLAGLIVAVGSLGAVQGEPRVIEGEKVVLTNAARTARIILTVEPDGTAALSFYREGNTAALGLIVTKDGTPALSMKNGRSAILAVQRDGTPALEFVDARQQLPFRAPR